MQFSENNSSIKGRGAQLNPHNRFQKDVYVKEHCEGIDDWEQENRRTAYIMDHPKSVVNKVDSPDVGMLYSVNPYQGCEHGCTYCYARNSHQYWGYSAGLDFEQKIIVKQDAPLLFRKFIEKKGWDAAPISISGNTDCYQPAERKFKLTRQILETALAYRQPISIITKNALVLRDMDILQELAKLKLVFVFFSINSLNEKLRLLMEPRTATAGQRLKTMEALSAGGITTGIMTAPVVPGLNDHEIPALLKQASAAGATRAGYTIVRLNGAIGPIFEDWLKKSFPDRAEKVWHMIQSCHHGQVNSSQFGARMRGEGNIAKMINDTFKLHCRLNRMNTSDFKLDSSLFRVPGSQYSLFD